METPQQILAQLELAEQYILLAEEHVARQKERVARQSGNPATSIALLRTFEESLRLFLYHRDLLKREVDEEDWTRHG